MTRATLIDRLAKAIILACGVWALILTVTL